MRSELIEAITHLKKFPDYVERPQFKMSGQDIRKIEVATKLQMPADLNDIYRELGRFAVTETELYFRATYSSGEEVVGEIQILCNRIDQILDFHETLIVSRDNPN